MNSLNISSEKVNASAGQDLAIDKVTAPLVGDPRFEALLNDPKNNAPLF